MSRAEAEAYLTQVPEWQLTGEARKIERTFRFADFASAMAFAQKVGEEAVETVIEAKDDSEELFLMKSRLVVWDLELAESLMYVSPVQSS